MNPLKCFCVILIALFNNKGNHEQLMDYYFQFDSEPTVRVFHYIDGTTGKTKMHWKVSTNPEKRTITTDTYNEDYNLINTFVEVVGEDEANLLAYTDYVQDDQQNTIKVEAEVRRDIVYSIGSKPISYIVQYNDTFGRTELEKTRTFKRYDLVNIRGTEYQCAIFQEKYHFHWLDMGDHFYFDQLSYYALGLGLVKIDRTTKEKKDFLDLKEVISLSEFESKLQRDKR